MKKYLNISEVAKYAGITRRTLIYYDEINLFKPKKIGENGYRYYTLDQFTDLDVILVLRSLNMSLEDIKNFLENKNPRDSRIELSKQQQKISQQIKQLLTAKKSLDRYLERYEKLESIDLTTITLDEQPEEYFVFSDIVHSYSDLNSATIYSEFYSYVAPEDLFNGDPLGFVTVREEDYLTDFHNMPYHILVKIDQNRRAFYDSKNIVTKPAGRYVSGFMNNEGASLIELQQRFHHFLTEKNLNVEGHIWEFLWQDETVARNDAELIFEVSIKIA